MQFPEHKCGLYLTHNHHKDYYTLAEIYLDYSKIDNDDFATPTSKQRCIETDQIWELQWYPNTPIGFNKVWGATLEDVLEKANQL